MESLSKYNTYKPQPSSTPSCRKSVLVTQSQNVPVSCFSQPIGQWPAQAAYREILGLAYAHVSPQLGIMLNVPKNGGLKEK